MDCSNNNIKLYCDYCNKKLKMINFTCKCNKTFCLMHKAPEQHNCTFNHKELFKEQLIKNNPIIKTLKIKTL